MSVLKGAAGEGTVPSGTAWEGRAERPMHTEPCPANTRLSAGAALIPMQPTDWPGTGRTCSTTSDPALQAFESATELAAQLAWNKMDRSSCSGSVVKRSASSRQARARSARAVTKSCTGSRGWVGRPTVNTLR